MEITSDYTPKSLTIQPRQTGDKTGTPNLLKNAYCPVSLTVEQLDMLLDFMDDNRDFACGRLRNADGRVKAKRLWDELANCLNAVSGSVKTVQQWQKDIKMEITSDYTPKSLTIQPRQTGDKTGTPNLLKNAYCPVSLTVEQLDMLLDFMDDNRDFACGRLRNADGRVKAKRLWDELANCLNAVSGSVKTVQQWQKVWIDRKHVAKRNAATKREQLACGHTSAPWEQRVLEIIGSGLTEQQTIEPAPSLPQNLDFEDNMSNDPLQHSQQSSRPSVKLFIRRSNKPVFYSMGQFDIMLDFMDKHQDLARGQLKTKDGRAKSDDLWEEIVKTLNSVQGSSKTVQQWQKVWRNRKHWARKNAAIRMSGLSSDEVTIAPWESRILRIIGYSYEFQSTSQESALSQNLKMQDSSDSTSQPLPSVQNCHPSQTCTLPETSEETEDTQTPLSIEQLHTLLEFMEQHRDLACGRLRSTSGRMKAMKLWSVITNTLNSLQGSVKTVQQWQKVWTDRKHMARKSVANKQTTGVWPSDWELRVISIVGETCGEPQNSPRKPAFTEDFDNEEDLASESYEHFQPQITPPPPVEVPPQIEFIPVQEADSTNICRICLNDATIYIFGETGQDIPKYITALTGVLIKRNDNLPKYMCEECYKLLQNAILFRKAARRTDSLLKRNKNKLSIKRYRTILRKLLDRKCEARSKVKDEKEETNMLIKEEPISDNDQNDGNSDLLDEKSYNALNDKRRDEIVKDPKINEQSEYISRNSSIKNENQSDDDGETQEFDTKDNFQNIGDDIVNQTSMKLLTDITYKENVKTRKKISKIIKKRKKIECRLCSKCLYNSECYIKHMRRFHQMEPDKNTVKCFGDRIPCEVCQKQIVYFKYHSHIKDVHSSTSQTPPKQKTVTMKPIQKTKRKQKVARKRECHICKKSYTRRYYLIHLELHKMKENGESGRCICEVCGKLFKLQTTLRAHRITHTNELPFICTYCPYRGRTKELLKLHVQTHTGDYPHKCPQCPYRFTSTGNLKKHMRRHEGKFTVFCDMCKKGFYTKPDLGRHVRAKHLGIKDHLCNICGIEFGYRTGLMAHQIKVHKRAKLHARAKPLYLQLENANSMGNVVY